jgi:acetyl-CoA synthetase
MSCPAHPVAGCSGTGAAAPWVWRPEDHDWTRDSHLARFMARHGVADFEELRRRAAADPEWFWPAMLDDLGLAWQRPWDQLRDTTRGLPWTEWFVGGAINLTDNCLDRHVAAGHGAETALLHEPDSDRPEDRRTVTFAALAQDVARCAAALRAAGLGAGDAVGLYAPMRPETVIALFAAWRIGAVAVPVFCGFGEEALAERLGGAGARVLFAAAAPRRRGKMVAAGTVARAAAARAGGVQRIVFVDTEDWPAWLAEGQAAGPQPTAAVTGAGQPCLVIYTSGTTGRPKGTVHTHGGVLATVGKELRHAFDVRPGEPFFWLTDIGWMMGPWTLVGCLLFRVPVVTFDGAPDWPTADRVWEVVARHGVVTLGLAPTVVRLLRRAAGAHGPEAHRLGSLRVLGATGEPWDEPSWRWYFERVGGGRCPVINISGGTELMGCLLQPYPVQPQKPCDLGTGALGVDVDVFDEHGRPVRGEVGYLVCRQPIPSMTRGFLGDPARYLETYFAQFPGVWSHGDWARIDEWGHYTLHGRADDTIKVAGKRVGPAEVEAALLAHPAVGEAAAFGVPDEVKGEAVVCLVVLKPGAAVAENELIAQVARALGKPLAPRAVHAVTALPKTRSGKIVRGTIRRAYLGDPPGDLASVEDPAGLEAVRAFGAAG